MRGTRHWTAFLAVIAVGHHLGTITAPLGDVGDTRWADWIDLALPWLVVATAGPVLLAARSRLGAAGLVAYTSGHGIHLAANSVATQDGGDTAYLWDELVGHAVWYAGMYLVVLALLRATRELPAPGPLRLVLAVAVGVTWCTNAIGGHSVPLAVVANAVLLVLALRDRRGTATDVAVASSLALVSLALYGVLDLDVEHT